MNPIEIFLPIFAIVALAITAPAWMHWLAKLSSAPAHVQFLGGLILPITVLLLMASWLEPRRDA
jgi:membrane protein implicated in regulation of membrane protease activity